MKFKPMLACDWHEEKLKFPCFVQPKIDGVHAVFPEGEVLSRKLTKFANEHVSSVWANAKFKGLCGEFTTRDSSPWDADLCRKTTSALNTIAGCPEMKLWAFDYVTPETKELPYTTRLGLLHQFVESSSFDNIEVVPTLVVHSMTGLLAFEQECLNRGYEGVIVRDPDAGYKYGRCGKTHAGVWRIKRFIQEEMVVTAVIEGNHNENEATKDSLGRTKRSTHKENMVGNGMVGALVGTLLKDIVCPFTGQVLLKAGLSVNVSAGGMTIQERKDYFLNQSKILGKIVSFKMFPKGVKDKPRFGTFAYIREDL